MVCVNSTIHRKNFDIKTSRKDQFFIVMSLCQNVHTADKTYRPSYVYVVTLAYIVCSYFVSVDHKVWVTLAT